LLAALKRGDLYPSISYRKDAVSQAIARIGPETASS
jgi:hypothetical protein